MGSIEVARFALSGAILGTLVPLLFIALFQILESLHAGARVSLVLNSVELGLWPSSIMLMGTADKSALEPGTIAVYAVSIALNAIVYAALASCIWYGIHRSRAVLIVMSALIVMGWVALSRL